MINYKLVYLDTGKLVPNQNEYKVKINPYGTRTIYHNDKFIGYVTKAKGLELARIERLEEQRQRRLKRKFDENVEAVFKEPAIDLISKNFYDMVYEQTNTGGRMAFRVPFKVKSVTNYAKYLYNAMTAGCITEKDALEWFKLYKGATTDEERNELWKQVKLFALGEGYADSY